MVMKIREEIVDFLKTEKELGFNLNFFQVVGYIFTRDIPKLWRYELSIFKLHVFDKFSTYYWIEGKEVIGFFDHLFKKLPAFVNLLGVQYQQKLYSGKSHDLYQQAECVVEFINKVY